MDKSIVVQYLNENLQSQDKREQDFFKLAICYALLDDFSKAKRLFEEAIVDMLNPNPFWKRAGLPEWLVEIFLLSGRLDLHPSIVEEMNLLRLSYTKSYPIGKSLVSSYCYSVTELLYPSGGNLSEWIEDLLKKPKVKYYHAIGQILQSVLEKDQSRLDQAMYALLKAHEGKVKHGELRWTPEGWICLPAMALSYLAILKNMKIEIENDYLLIDYLAFLKERTLS